MASTLESVGYVHFMDLDGLTYEFRVWRKRKKESEGYVHGIKFKQGEQKEIAFIKGQSVDNSDDSDVKIRMFGLDDSEISAFLHDVCVVFLEKISEYFEVVSLDKEWKAAYDGIFEYMMSYLRKNTPR